MNLQVTGAWLQAKDYIGTIEKQGHSVAFLQCEKEELPCVYEWVEGVICNGLFLYHAIEKFTNLKYIQLTSAGFDRVPMEYVQKHGIEIHNAQDVYSIPIAEYVLGGVLQLYKQTKFFQKNQEVHCWKKQQGLQEVFGKNVCIVGCGNIGRECAKRFRAFGCEITGVNRTVREDEFYDKMVSLKELEMVLPQVDIVVLTIALTEETRHFFDEKMFSKMKAGSVFVNVSRGAVVDEGAMIEAIKSNLSGAVLDVFEEEPLSESSVLWDMENVIVTPHNSFVGDGNGKRLGKIVFDNLMRK